MQQGCGDGAVLLNKWWVGRFMGWNALPNSVMQKCSKKSFCAFSITLSVTANFKNRLFTVNSQQ
jgi:hypothetical protein